MIILHENNSQFVYKLDRNKLFLKLKIQHNRAEEVDLIFFDRGLKNYTFLKMELLYATSDFDYFFVLIEKEDNLRYLKYFFAIKNISNNQFFYFGQHGISNKIPNLPFEFLYLNEGDVNSPVEWLKNSIFYQIFPDRFKNGNKFNDPENVEDWNSLPTRENFMGGDLEGIKKSVAYLSDLGVNCIYLNPIFKADFNHKYATTDYYEIDPMFGNKEDFKLLVDECHKFNIKILLDGVFNHSGINFFAFKDIIENNKNSEYKDWFYIKKYPISISEHDYECVGNYKWMPKLNTSNKKVQDYFIDVIKYWVEKFNIDGWRLDVADEVDKLFLMRAKAELKSAFNDKALIGETWGYPGDMMVSNQVDSVMNYVFRDILIEYVATKKIDTKEFINRMNKMYGEFTDVYNDTMYNLLDSHDTDRFYTLCNEDDLKYKLAVILQFFLKGSPAIYYGDEIGITGFNDPDCRKTMDWDKVSPNNDILNHFKKCIALRNNFSSLRLGSIQFSIIDGLLRISRTLNDETIYLYLNNSDENLQIKTSEFEEKKLIFSNTKEKKELFVPYEFRVYQ